MKTVLSLFLAIVMIVIGTAVLTYQGFTFTTAERQLVSLGPLTAGTQELNWTITLPPILGGILLAGGTLLVFLIAIVMRSPRHEIDGKAPVGLGGNRHSKRQVESERAPHEGPLAAAK